MRRSDALVFRGLLFLLVATPSTPALAGFCSFLSGDARMLCEAASAATKSAPAKPKLAEQAAGESNTSQPASPARAGATAAAPVTAVQQSPDVYRVENFKGLATWIEVFEKAVNDPQAFKTFLAGMVETANGSDAKVYALVTGPQRNHYQKFMTDYQLYTLYYPKPATFLAKARQCTAPRDYTAAEACDCVAGFVGDAALGTGTGELVASSNAKTAINACGRAAELAPDAKSKARYIAQRARAQVYTMDTFQSIQWTDEAIKLGYARAIINKPSAALHDFEVRNSGFPPMSHQESEDFLKVGADWLRDSKKVGVRETFIVAQQFKQAIAIFKFNSATLTPIFKSMMAPPPASAERDDCALAPAGVNGAGGIVYGMKC